MKYQFSLKAVLCAPIIVEQRQLLAVDFCEPAIVVASIQTNGTSNNASGFQAGVTDIDATFAAQSPVVNFIGISPTSDMSGIGSMTNIGASFIATTSLPVVSNLAVPNNPLITGIINPIPTPLATSSASTTNVSSSESPSASASPIPESSASPSPSTSASPSPSTSTSASPSPSVSPSPSPSVSPSPSPSVSPSPSPSVSPSPTPSVSPSPSPSVSPSPSPSVSPSPSPSVSPSPTPTYSSSPSPSESPSPTPTCMPQLTPEPVPEPSDALEPEENDPNPPATPSWRELDSPPAGLFHDGATEYAMGGTFGRGTYTVTKTLSCNPIRTTYQATLSTSDATITVEFIDGWIFKNSSIPKERLLGHEQLHWSMAEYTAGKFDSIAKSVFATGTGETAEQAKSNARQWADMRSNEISTLHQSFQSQMQQMYDAETNHGEMVAAGVYDMQID